jgi:hypothetical protein
MFNLLRVFAILAGLAMSIAAQPLHAQIHIPAGARVQVGDGGLQAGGLDLTVSGALLVSAGQVHGLRHVSIAPGGLINAGTGLLRVAGDWRNDGSFVRGSSLVDFVDGAGLAEATISGSSQFARLSLVSTQGKRYRFAVGTEQRIDTSLRIRGTSASAIQIASTQAGQVARIGLANTGTQDMAFIGVSDVHASGQPLAPLLTNQGGTGNDRGWFGNPPDGVARPIPSLNLMSLTLMALLFGLLARPALTRLQTLR